MKCPYCQSGDSHVVDSRDAGDLIRRRRECLQCHQRFTTYERVAPVNVLVIKRDGRREEFDREKLYRGLRIACAKRPIADEKIEALVHDVENAVFNLGKAEVESRVIGGMVMDRLRELDEVAYVRFASVYHRFKDVDGLVEEIESLKHWKSDAQKKRKTRQKKGSQDGNTAK